MGQRWWLIGMVSCILYFRVGAVQKMKHVNDHRYDGTDHEGKYQTVLGHFDAIIALLVCVLLFAFDLVILLTLYVVTLMRLKLLIRTIPESLFNGMIESDYFFMTLSIYLFYFSLVNRWNYCSFILCNCLVFKLMKDIKFAWAKFFARHFGEVSFLSFISNTKAKMKTKIKILCKTLK